MRPGYDENPVNPVPAIIWVLALPIVAAEAYFGLGRLGFLSGGPGAGQAARQIMVERTAFAPEFLIRAWDRHSAAGGELWRLLTYPFVHYSFTHALFVVVFLLALGNMVARVFRPWAVAALAGGDDIDDVVKRLRDNGSERVLVVTYMVADGVLRDRMVTQAETAGAVVVPGTLGGTDALADLVVQRAEEAQARR